MTKLEQSINRQLAEKKNKNRRKYADGSMNYDGVKPAETEKVFTGQPDKVYTGQPENKGSGMVTLFWILAVLSCILSFYHGITAMDIEMQAQSAIHQILSSMSMIASILEAIAGIICIGFACLLRK